MEKAVSAAEANRSFSRLLRWVREGQSFVITSHGRGVARIVPLDEGLSTRIRARASLLKRLRNQRSQDIGRWTREELYDE